MIDIHVLIYYSNKLCDYAHKLPGAYCSKYFIVESATFYEFIIINKLLFFG